MAEKGGPVFEDLAFLARLKDVIAVLDEYEENGQISTACKMLIETGFPDEELRERAQASYIGKKSNAPVDATSARQPEHKAFFKLLQNFDELALSWQLAKFRITKAIVYLDKIPTFEIEHEPKPIEELRAEIMRFTDDFTNVLRNFRRIVSENDLQYSDDRMSGPNFDQETGR